VKRYRDRRWFPEPVEAHELWDMFHPVENSKGGPPFVEEDAAAADRQGMRLFIANILRFSRRARFLNKNTRNTRRIRYLQAIFPDACFIHIIRDGRAVANSFLNIDWWPRLSVWWANGRTTTQLEREGADPVMVAAQMWKSEVERVLQDAEYVSPERYIEVRYEKLMQYPIRTMLGVLDFCGLSWTSEFQEHIEAFDIKTRNFKWMDRFTAQQMDCINKEIGPLLEQLEYS
jgi:hypothetical protein